MSESQAPRERAEINDEMTTQELIARYTSGPALLRDTVAGMDPDQLRARPIEGKMSSQEVVNHIVDSEGRMVERMRRAIAGEEPLAMGGHPDPTSRPERDVAADLTLLEATRERFAEELRALTPETWERIAMRRDDRVMTVRQFLALVTRHLENHVKTIEEKRAALGL